MQNLFRFLSFCLLVGSSAIIYAHQPVDPTQIQIVRDTYGTPYIYAPTDAQVAYGLAWANAEDAFDVMQETVLTGLGRYGEVKGVDGAKRDFLVKSLQLKERVDTLYENSFSEAYKAYLEGYVQGLNAYAASHPTECLLKDAFPITVKQYVQGTMFICCYMQYIQKDVERILKGKYDAPMSHQGSNFYGFTSAKTTDGSSYMCANPHQPLEGPFSWYEAHLKSDEGLDVHGCLFFAGASIAIGNTPNLGWTMTFNSLDLTDVYELTTRTVGKKIYYQFNNEWYPLHEVDIALKVKIAGSLITIHKKTFTSIHGPVYTSKNGNYYAVRCGALFNVKANEQLYQMNKAQNFDQWYKAIELQGLPRYNIMYVDKEDHLMYLDNAQIPQRTKGFNYTKPLDANNPNCLWNSFIPVAQLPQVKDPACGYVFNTNNSEFTCTCAADMPDSTDHIKYPREAAYRITENNRSIRFMELIQAHPKFDYTQFKNIKYDASYPSSGAFLRSIIPMLALDKTKYPDVAYEIEQLQTWNKVLDTNSIAAAISISTFHFMFEDKHYGSNIFLTGISCTEAEWIKYIRMTKAHLMKYFHTDHITYGTLCRQIRGTVSTPSVGFPDMLQASYSKPNKEGVFQAYIGDSYLQFARFNKDGIISCESMLPFGISSHASSKHYTDQMNLYVTKNCKPVYFNKDDLLKHSEQNYFLK